ncbi:MAG: AI-2E family transporter [Candidatus Nanohaloarchaeota archaeon]|nr:AI-2E family transporter [Candidatus Nanohaloarchaeota archaeon]
MEKREYKIEIKKEYVTDLILLGVIAILTILVIKPFFKALIFALLTAYMLRPLVDLIYRFIKFYRLSLFISLLILLVPTFAFIYYAAEGARPLIEKTTEISASLNNFIEYLMALSNQNSILRFFNVAEYLKNFQDIVDILTQYLKNYLRSSLSNIPHILINVMVYFVATYYFIVDSHKLEYYYYKLLERVSKKKQFLLNAVLKGLKNAFDVLVVSYITMTLITTVLAYIIYFAFDVPYALLWAILTGLFALLPILGAWMVYGGVSAYLYFIGEPTKALITLLYGLIVLTLIPDLVLRPALSSKQAKVHPLTVILGFFGGPIIFGFIGFIIGPAIMVIFETVVKEYYEYYVLRENNK